MRQLPGMGRATEQNETEKSQGRQLQKALRHVLKTLGELLKSCHGKVGVLRELELLGHCDHHGEDSLGKRGQRQGGSQAPTQHLLPLVFTKELTALHLSASNILLNFLSLCLFPQLNSLNVRNTMP